MKNKYKPTNYLFDQSISNNRCRDWLLVGIEQYKSTNTLISSSRCEFVACLKPKKISNEEEEEGHKRCTNTKNKINNGGGCKYVAAKRKASARRRRSICCSLGGVGSLFSIGNEMVCLCCLLNAYQIESMQMQHVKIDRSCPTITNKIKYLHI
jgi:hypothetical protein